MPISYWHFLLFLINIKGESHMNYIKAGKMANRIPNLLVMTPTY